MNPQQLREISTGILLRIGWLACISVGIVSAAFYADGGIPTWLRAGLLAFGISLFFLALVVLIIEEIRQEKDLILERKQKAARLPRQAYEPTKPPDPKDGGETPTPEFLSIVFEHHYNSKGTELPAVRSQAFAAAGLNPSRVQAMYTRCATWGMIVGRVQGGSGGRIAEGWTHVEARARMVLERPDYGVVVKG